MKQFNQPVKIATALDGGPSPAEFRALSVKAYAVFDFKPLIVTDDPVIPVLDPPFVGGLHVIVYELPTSCGKCKVIDECVDDILDGGLVFPATEK